jgi:hypothetical protein
LENGFVGQPGSTRRGRATLASPAWSQLPRNDSPCKMRITASFLQLLGEVQKKQGKIADHSQRIVEEHQVYCSTL